MNILNARVAVRLGAGFGLLLALILALAATSIIRFSSFNSGVQNLSEQKVPNLELAYEWTIEILQTARHTRNMLILDDQALVQKEIDAVRESQKKRNTIIEQLQKKVTSEEGKAALGRVINIRQANIEGENAYLKLLEAGDKDAAKQYLLEKARPAQLATIDELYHFIDVEKAVVAKATANAEQEYTFGSSLVAIQAVIALIIGIIAAWLITRSLTRQLGGEPGYAVEVANRIAAGDLASTVELKQGDQHSLLHALHAMRDNLVRIVAEVREGAHAISAASSEIATGNQDLSNRTEEQAASLEETASSMEELTSTVKQNADNALQANQLAASASDIAQRGGSVVADVVHTMSEINDSSKRITEIISVIDGIAFQTNILALNAAVEAARAGEQGRGFAVVAAEVRNLAQRSASAAKEIKTLIDDSTSKVNSGTALVDQAGTTMQEVLDSVKRLGDIVSEIAAASREQASGIDQVNQSVTQMDEATQQNASLVEEAAAASEAMHEQAEHLTQVVGVFQLSATHKLATGPKRTAAKQAAVVPLKRPAPIATAQRKLAAPARKQVRLTANGAPVEGDWEAF